MLALNKEPRYISNWRKRLKLCVEKKLQLPETHVKLNTDRLVETYVSTWQNIIFNLQPNICWRVHVNFCVSNRMGLHAYRSAATPHSHHVS